jgi:hypothetical protein
MSTSPAVTKYQAVETFYSKKERTARRWELFNHHKYDVRNLKDRPGFELGTYLLEYEIWTTQYT